MTWTEGQYKRIHPLLPKPRKKAEVDNLTFFAPCLKNSPPVQEVVFRVY